jgi:cell division septation protein DedD
MTAITATARTHRRSLAVIGAIVAIALAVIALVLFKTSPAQDMHQVVTTYHHLPHLVQALLGAQHLGS